MTTPTGGTPAGGTPVAGRAAAAGPSATPGVSSGSRAPSAGRGGSAGAASAGGTRARSRASSSSSAGSSGKSAAARNPAGGGTRRRAKPSRPPRLASLQLRRVDPWTVLKISLIVSIVMFFVWMIAVGVLYLSLDSLDVWSKINSTYNTLVVTPESTAATSDLITPGTVFGVTAIIGAVNIVLFTALSAIGAFVYNAAAGMAGGVEVTLGERD